MMQEPIFLKPVFQKKIWGGSRLNPYLVLISLMTKSGKIGQSAHIHMALAL